MKLKCNCCDGVYNSFDVHFTSTCPFDCAHCIDKKYGGLGIVKPDVNAIVKTVVENQAGVDDILFLGGEPCAFMDELIDCIEKIKKSTSLKVYVTTAVPNHCIKRSEKFRKMIDLVDGLNISAQHWDENVADTIRRTYGLGEARQEFYDTLPHKQKIRINLNIVKPFLYTKEDITKCLYHYDGMGFNSIKLSEIQHGKDYFVSFEKTFGIDLGSAFANGCQTYIDTSKLFPELKTPVLLKRSCFMCEETLRATFADGVKAFCNLFISPKNKYGVIYEDGTLKGGWV